MPRPARSFQPGIIPPQVLIPPHPTHFVPPYRMSYTRRTDIECLRSVSMFLGLIAPLLLDLTTPASCCHSNHLPLTPLVSPMRPVRQLHPSTGIEPTGLDFRFSGLIPTLLLDLATLTSYCYNYPPPFIPLVSPMRTAKELHPAPIFGFWG